LLFWQFFHEYMKTALDYVEVDKKLHTMSMMSGLIRPSGKSIRDRFLKGKVGDNGHPEIDKAFPNTSGFCVYQEDIIKSLSISPIIGLNISSLIFLAIFLRILSALA